jgi:HEAT repeat protein
MSTISIDFLLFLFLEGFAHASNHRYADGMADTSIQKLLHLLEPEQPGHVRTAAALVLGEMGDRDGDVSAALCERLDDADLAVRLQVISAVGKLRIEKALPRLLESVQAGGDEAERAAQAVAHLGVKGTRALQDLMDKVAPGLRRRIAGALASGGTASAETAAVDALLDKDPGVVEAAARSLIGNIPTLTPSHRQALADHLLDLLKGKKAGLVPSSQTAVVRLLAALDDARAEKILWDRILPPHSPEIRAAALQALGKWVEEPGKDQVKRLLTCATDADFRVAAPALMILKALPAVKQAPSEWLSLLDAPDVTVRHFAIEKLGERDTPEVAAALLKQLDHPDKFLGEQAVVRLAKMKHGRAALSEALLEAESPEKCWFLVKSLTGLAKDFPPAWRAPFFPKACSWIDANDRRGDALLSLLRDLDPESLGERLEKRAIELRKKKKYPEALTYLRLIARDPACAPAMRMELGACGLKVSGHDLSAEARAADHALSQFNRLLPSYETEALAFLKKTKWLGPEDLFYLGFHFADQSGPTRKFGGQVLKMLIQRSPRVKLAQDAKRKLRSAALD